MEEFIAQREQHIATAAPGPAAARRLCRMTDDAVRTLSRAASPLLSGRWAIAALGGWGAGALLPRSDLDLLVLSDAPAEKLKPFVEAILYPLWDAGLKVGHQVRSPAQQLKAMRADLKTCTAALTARPLEGDVVWAGETVGNAVSTVSKRRKRVIAQIHGRDRRGSAYLLEPDLKEGVGGRRDFDELTWTASLVTGVRQSDPSSLVKHGLLSSAELVALTDDADAVATARWELHAGGHGDLLSLDAVSYLTRVDAERVQAALGSTALALERVRARLAGHPRRETDLGPREILSLLEQGPASLGELELAASAGQLDSCLPGYSALMSTRRPGLGHEFTVGAHCLKAASVTSCLPPDGALSRSLDTLRDPRVLLVAALTHDVGKMDAGPGHSERGVAPAVRAALSFGLSAEAATDVGDLVGHHLLLAETALRSDLDDEDAILRCAARIARRELLAPLHVLTVADSVATGPSTWTPWTAALVGTLVARLDAALSPEVDGAGLADRGEATRQATLERLTSSSAGETAFVSRAPLRYLASREPAEVSRDATLVAALASSAAERVLMAVSSGPAENTDSVTLVTHDRPELLSRVAGAMALAGLDILAVDAYSASDGIALDSFVVTSATGRPASTDTFAALERLVGAALKDRLELASRLAQRRGHYPARSEIPVSVEALPSGWDTTLSVTAPDRPGLLHDLTRAISLEGVDIRWAKAQTIDGVARDVFHVVGPDGGPVDDPGTLGHLAMRIRESA